MGYWYTYRLRGYSIGCQPKGVIQVKESPDLPYELIAYSRQLTDAEVEEYELIYLGRGIS